MLPNNTCLNVNRCLAFPFHGLRERRRGFFDSLPDRPLLHRTSALLHGTLHGAVRVKEQRQGVGHGPGIQRLDHT